MSGQPQPPTDSPTQPRPFPSAGGQLKRLTEHQTTYKHLWYNEIIVDAAHWRQHLPAAVEAIYGDRRAHGDFLKEFGVSEATHPYLELDPTDWHAPFSWGP